MHNQQLIRVLIALGLAAWTFSSDFTNFDDIGGPRMIAIQPGGVAGNMRNSGPGWERRMFSLPR